MDDYSFCRLFGLEVEDDVLAGGIGSVAGADLFVAAEEVVLEPLVEVPPAALLTATLVGCSA